MVIDVGNTHTVIGVYSDSLKKKWRLATDRTRTADEYWMLLSGLATASKIDLTKINGGALSCVVPKLTTVFRQIYKEYLSCEPVIVNSSTELGIRYPVDDASYIGSDLIVDAYAALKKYCTNIIICDFGSATTVQLIGSNGYFYGTVICPGLQMSVESLVKGAAQLSGIELGGEFRVLGTSTKEAMLSGIIRGHALMIDGFISEIREEFKTLNPIKVVATGGIAKLVSNYSRLIEEVDETLTLDGLDLISRLYSC